MGIQLGKNGAAYWYIRRKRGDVSRNANSRGGEGKRDIGGSDTSLSRGKKRNRPTYRERTLSVFKVPVFVGGKKEKREVLFLWHSVV